MSRDSIFLTSLLLLIVLMFTFGSRLGMRTQTLLARPIATNSNAPQLATISQTVEGYGLSNTLSVQSTSTGKSVPVYSRYPFNLKNEILIAAGSKDNVAVGDTVLFQGSVLGSVEKVFDDSALVETIFDSRFKTSVRIGSSGTDALLVGGPEPKLTLIPAAAKVAENDPVYAAAEGWPYGTTLGALSGIKDANDNIYRSGVLRIFYNPAALTSVTVLKPSGS